jgi:hypothetical protein
VLFRFWMIALTAGLAFAGGSHAIAADGQTAPPRVEVAKSDGGGWQLLRDGKPYFIKGGGGGGSKEQLAKLGGNSFRTWGVGDDTQAQLDEAQKLGLTVSLGIWLRHTSDGFDYHDPRQVAEQYENARKAILRYKDHPAVLLWGIGNEMEGFKAGDDPAIWKAVDDIAALVKKLDPNHPTMTVIAELGGARVKSTNALCPHVDIVGINSYGGIASIGERYRKAGGAKPYVVTEFGPPGTWECAKNGWGIPLEPSSTAKGEIYRQGYLKAVLGEKDLCLGSYVFIWGHKQEATPTWFGLFLPDGTQLEAVHVMAELWSGRAPTNRCPRIDVPKVNIEQATPGQTIRASINVSDPDGDPLKLKWVLSGEVKNPSVGGGKEDPAPEYPDAIIGGSDRAVQVKMPTEPGTYRLFAYARDGHGNGAVANAVLRVTESTAPPAGAGGAAVDKTPR